MITKGKQVKAQKVVIYGPEGIGKTTIASRFPNPVFIDTEGGTAHFDVARTETPINYQHFEQCYYEDILPNMGQFQTVVIDTYDWLEQLIIAEVCRANGKAGIEDFGYGKGYTYLVEKTNSLLKLFDGLIDCGINVVLLCHAQMRKFELPEEGGSYDRWELKLAKKTCPIIKEWADMLLFCNYKTILVTGADGKNHAQGGKRVMYTSHRPVWDAKNRHGLAEELPMEFESIAHCIPALDVEKIANAPGSGNLAEVAKVAESLPNPADPEYAGIPADLVELMKRDGIKPGWVRDYIAERGWGSVDTPWSELNPKMLKACVKNWAKVCDVIKSVPDDQRLPF